MFEEHDLNSNSDCDIFHISLSFTILYEKCIYGYNFEICSRSLIYLRVTELILPKNYDIHYHSSQYVLLSSGPEKVLALKSCVVLAQKWMQAAPEKV